MSKRHAPHKTSVYQRGYATLISVLIVSAIGIAIAITVAVMAIGEGQSALSLSRGEGTLAFTEGCMEDALMQLQASASYTGGTITQPEGTCTVTVNSASAPNYTITAATTATNYRRTVQVVANRGSTIVITSWKEQ